ncbi:hypothetical protein BC829DRAFT_441260 [Chytridium lagenaria]|nr:hypothetical protein BC829DRAFT_441260 [Chytridium lagenaria]
MTVKTMLLSAVAVLCLLISPAWVSGFGSSQDLVGQGSSSSVSNNNVTIQAGETVQWTFSVPYYLFQQPALNNCTPSASSEFGGNRLINSGSEGYTYRFQNVGTYFWYVDRLSRSECSEGGQGTINVIAALPATTSPFASGTAAPGNGGNGGSGSGGGITQTVVTGTNNVITGPSVPYVTFGGAAQMGGAGMAVMLAAGAGLVLGVGVFI